MFSTLNNGSISDDFCGWLMPVLSNKWLTCTANQSIKKLAFKVRKFLSSSLDESEDIMPRGSWSESARLHARKHGHDTSQERTSSATSMPCTFFGIVPFSAQNLWASRLFQTNFSSRCLLVWGLLGIQIKFKYRYSAKRQWGARCWKFGALSRF